MVLCGVFEGPKTDIKECSVYSGRKMNIDCIKNYILLFRYQTIKMSKCISIKKLLSKNRTKGNT